MPKRLRVDRDVKRKVFVPSSKGSMNASLNNNSVLEHNYNNSRKTIRCNHGNRSRGSTCPNCESLKARRRDNPAALHDEGKTVFPKGAILYVFAATLLVRIGSVSQKKNWWILHADEVFQIVEVAHSEVYGYGFRPYEYLAPPSGNFSSNSAQTEANLGMYGLRSFILPKVFMLVFTLAEFVGVKDQPFLVAKLFHGLVSSCLPLSVHKLTKAIYRSEDAAVMAAIFSAASLHLNLFGTHVLVNSFLAPLVFWCLANILLIMFETNSNFSDSSEKSIPETVFSASLNNNNNKTSPHNNINTLRSNFRNTNIRGNWDLIKTGILLGICSYIRNDLVLFIGVFLFPFVLREFRLSLTYVWTLIKLAVCFVSGMALAGVDDWISYSQFGLSIYQWIRFNFISNLPATFFGTSSGTKYIVDIFMCNWACLAMTVMSVFCIASQAVSTSERAKDHFKTNNILLFECFILLIIYSLQPHKETRFLHNVIVVICIVQANAVFSYADNYCRENYGDGNYTQRALYFIVATYVLMSWLFFPNVQNGSFSRWTFTRNRYTHDVNVCVSYISQQDDVRGVFSGHSLQETGGFSLLHKNVTFFTLVAQRVCEYSPESRVVMTSLNPFTLRPYNISVSLVNKVSDYVTFDNMAYVHKQLIEDARYNYAIVSMDVDFSSLGYEDVFKSVNNKVVKRSNSAKSLKAAREFMSQLPVWRNSTVLEYEGSRLMNFGLPLKAIPRLKKAIALDPTRVQPYQILMKAYTYLRDKEAYTAVRQKCISTLGQELCLTP